MASTSVPPIVLRRGATFNEQAAALLRSYLYDGRLKPGERLNEAKLATDLGISRGPIREAIQRLASEGLIEHIPHRGAYVPVFHRRALQELYEARMALEMMATELAAERATAEQIEGLRALHEEVGHLLESGVGAYPLERDLHQRIVEISGNTEILSLVHAITQRIQLARFRSSQRPERARQAHEEHLTIVCAIQARDGPGAARSMRAHIARSMDTSLSVVCTE